MSADLDKLRAQIRDRDLEVYTGGYDQAVADIRQMLALEKRRERSAGKWAAVNLLARLGGMLAIGAHVGAAKKGST